MLERSSIVKHYLKVIKPLRIGPIKPYYPCPKRKGVPLTVCIAAICENTKIFGASDRMMTSGDIEFEPDLDVLPPGNLAKEIAHMENFNEKIIPLTSAIVVLTAGDSGLQAEIVDEVRQIVWARNAKEPDNWWVVKDVVDVYEHCYNQAKAKRARAYAFTPFGLDENTFLSKQKDMHEAVVAEILERIKTFDAAFSSMHSVETIITGMDQWAGFPRPHIYQIIKSEGVDAITCCDSIGFSSIGSGSRHAESQFMLSGHSPYSAMAETLLLTYMAKKRSEVAPGVGKGTDMFAIGPTLSSFAMLDRIKDFDMKAIDQIYKDVEKGQSSSFEKAKNKTKAYMKKMFEKREKAKAKPQQSAESKPS